MSEEYKIYELSKVNIQQLIHESYENGEPNGIYNKGVCLGFAIGRKKSTERTSLA